MREFVRNLLVGATSIVALIVLVALLLLFGELDRFVHPRYALTINTDRAMGLRPGSSVELNGVPIGVVDDVALREHGEYPVQVTALINRKVSIPADAVPYAATSLLGGAAVLEIDAVARDTAAGFLPQDGTAQISSPLLIRMITQITRELDARMQPLMDALVRFDELSDTYTQLGRNLNILMQPQDEQALADGEEPNLRTAIIKLYDVLENTDAALVLARDWLGDEQLRADAKAAIEKASTLIDQASESLTNVTTIIEDLAADAGGAVEDGQALIADADALIKRLMPVADEMATTLEEVQRLTALATTGDGTVARLLNDPQLYNSLDDAATRLEQALKEIRLFIEKAKAEGLPIQY